MSLPIQGNQYFTQVKNVASSDVERVKTDNLDTTNASVGGDLKLEWLQNGPTGPTGPNGTAAVAGQLAVSQCNSAGVTGPFISVYTGSAWKNVTLS